MKTSKSSITMGRKLFLWSGGGISLLILLLLFSIWRTGDRALNFVSNLLKISPIEPKVTPSMLVVEKIRNIQELSTTVQTIETIVPTSAERKLGNFSLATTKLLYVARGEIRAGIDLNELTDLDVQVTSNSITVNLPPAKILDSKIDVNHSYVYNYDRGLLNLGPDIAPQLQTLAQKNTLAQMVNTACEEDILDKANMKAQEAITNLLSVSSKQRINVRTRIPLSCGVITEENSNFTPD